MKTKLLLLLFICGLIFSCSKDNILETENYNEQSDYNSRRLEPTETDPIVLYEDLLMAGQNIVSGSIHVELIDGTVTVTYNTNADCEIEETHLFVGDLNDLPTNGGGNPKIGKFPYKNSHPTGTNTVTYSTIQLNPGECVYVAAHAVVKNVNSGQTETAWGNGISIGGNSWAMMFEVCY